MHGSSVVSYTDKPVAFFQVTAAATGARCVDGHMDGHGEEGTQAGPSVWYRRTAICPLKRPLDPPPVGSLSALRSLLGPVPAAHHGHACDHLHFPPSVGSF